MNELWQASGETRVRGWRLAAKVTIRLCCRVLVPALRLSAERRGRLGLVGATLSATRTPPCAKP